MAKTLLSKSNLSLGVQIEFFFHWSNWSKSKEFPNAAKYEQSTSNELVNTLQLPTILNSNAYGQSVLKSYEKQNSLNDNTRKLLCESIIHYCIEKEHNLSVKDSENIAKQIINLFPEEEISYYYLNRPNAAPLGKLYNKYRNWKNNLSRKTKIEHDVPDKPNTSSEEEEGHLRILKHEFNNMPFEQMIQHWNKCFHYRTKTLKNSETHILDLWPMYKTPIGFRLIDNDYQQTYGEANIFLDTFDNFSDLMIQKVFPTMSSKFKEDEDNNTWEYLKNNNCIDYNSKFLMVLSLLQSLLPSARIKSKAFSKGSTFYTKMESKRSFLSFAATQEEYQERLDNKIKNERSIPPFITVIGDIYKPQAFFTDFDNIKYKFFSITKAIDICFKAYQIFNIEYPDPSKHMWDFLNMQFYKVNGSHAISPATKMFHKKIQEFEQ